MSTKHLEKVAIVGATGRVGKAFAEALVKTGKHTITAITRSDSKGKLPEGVKSVPINYDNEDELVKAIKGQQFLIITLSVQAPPDLHSKILKAAKKAEVPYVMPNIYGGDKRNVQYAKESLYGDRVLATIQELDDMGLDYITLCCGFWYEWSLACPEPWFGFDVGKKTVTFIDDGKTKISTSTWDQCGNAIAALLSLPESGVSPSLSDWKNGTLYAASFLVSQRDMLDSLHRVMGTTDKDWTISYEPAVDRYNRGLELLKKGEMTGFATAMYTRTFYPNGDGDFHKDLENEKLGLPQEKLDDATRRAVDMVESGWTPFGGQTTPREPPNWAKKE